ncbi:phage terminase small subunit P27 family [Hymenobacter glaciei]|uniref:phage terminase small subunit P27 family n=1 Tax=Hymenobacter glaciei TaxID=877209 RepID=UPI0031E64BD5
MKVCTVADGPALQLLTEALAEWAQARQAVQDRGLTYETTTVSGNIMRRPNPEVAIAADAWRRALAMLSQFGLTPAARSKVSAQLGEDAKDPFADMLADLK